MGMLEGRHGAGLGEEAGQEVPLPGPRDELGVQHFDRHAALEEQVEGEVHAGERPLADLAIEPVAPVEDLAACAHRAGLSRGLRAAPGNMTWPRSLPVTTGATATPPA